MSLPATHSGSPKASPVSQSIFLCPKELLCSQNPSHAYLP